MDTRLLKATNDEGGTLTAQLASTETTTAHITPVPDKAPGLITCEPGTSNEEAIYYKSRDSGAGTISGLTRDYTNINGGTGKLHDNGSDWETLQATEYNNNIVDALTEGFYLEHQTCTKVTTSSFTVEGNQTAFYTAGRQIRINGSINAVVSSSSYSSPNTTVIVDGTPISAAITSVELSIQPKGASDIVAVRKATGAEVTTGTEDAKIVTPKAIGDADLNTRLKSKKIIATRDLTAASGDVAYTGVGFRPTSIHAFANVDAASPMSIGVSDSNKDAATITTNPVGVFYSTGNLIQIYTDVTGPKIQTAIIKSYDPDGFTLTWTKGDLPTGTAQLRFICYR